MLTMWLEYQQELVKAQQAAFPGFGANATSAMQQSMDAARDNWAAWEKQAADWTKTVEHWLPSDMKADSSDTLIAESLKRLLDPRYFASAALDEVSASVQKLAEGPEFADIGLFEKHVLQSTSEWLAMREADANYRQITGAAWARAFQTYNAEFAGDWSQLAGDPRKALDRWLEIANDELIRTQRRKDFLEASRKLFRASLEYRLKQRELTEIWCENHSIPTRTEVDDLHRTVTELRRELRALKRQLSTQTVAGTSSAEPVAGTEMDTAGMNTAEMNTAGPDAAKAAMAGQSATAPTKATTKAVAKKAPAKTVANKKVAAGKSTAKVAAKKKATSKVNTKKAVTKKAAGKKTPAAPKPAAASRTKKS